MKSLTIKPSSRKILRTSGVKPGLFRRKTDLPFSMSQQLILSREFFLGNHNDSLYRRSSDLDRVKSLSDNELIVVICTQNREAYKELFLRYQKKLFTYIYHLVGNREETEDILQNVFSKTYKSIKHFDTSRKFSSWIYRIAHNESVNYLKRKSKRYTVSWDDITTSKDKLDSASNEELPEDRMGHQEIVKQMDLAMLKIPPKYQEVLRLRYFNEYSYEEMGKILGKPLNTVGTLINRAKKKLLEVVEKDEKK
ncbi:MAG: RNA polymerase sigma factor [Candidatus Moranbacteria bacterium]|nr:RNA polymerase sigma factor [Candidatus Moranbacteria bacterium]